MSSPFHRTASRIRFVHRALRYRFRVEPAEVRFVLRHVAPGQSAIDIGAHKGAFTYWLSQRVGRRGQVFAFEPIPALADYLRSMKRLFPLPNTSIHQAALADREERRVLHVPRDNYIGTSSFTPDDNPQGHDTLDVTTYPLDVFLQSLGNPQIDFIKCDVEGHELDVLRGAEATLKRCHPMLLIECEDVRNGGGQLHRVRSFLSQFDYDCLVLDGRRPQRFEDSIEAMRSSSKRVGVDAWRNFGFV